MMPVEFDADFQSASGLTDRRLCKIQYSPLHRFPLLALGDNPGGVSGGDDLLESSTFYEDGKHDIVEFRNDPRYHIAAGMFTLFAAILNTRDLDAIRRIPYLNVTFRRSQNKAALKMKAPDAARESAPILTKIIKLVDPSYLLIMRGGFTEARKRGMHLSGLEEVDVPVIRTPNGEREARAFQAFEGTLNATGRRIPIVVVSHPSIFAKRKGTWTAVAEATRDFFEKRGLREAVLKSKREKK